MNAFAEQIHAPYRATLKERVARGRVNPGDPFEMPPEYDVHSAISSLQYLVDGGFFADKLEVEWKIKTLITTLEGELK